ncbi:MAG TPA: metallophosphoesterase [Acidimicrobiales bacterium]|nr:metallophosphoesterase [Acidimicrobiales bacterium]
MTCLVFVLPLWFAGGMRVAAIGDAHLGRSYLPITTAGGVNQREVDFEQSFEAAVDLALAQEPDLVVWLGDVFDHPRPTYRAFRVAQRGMAKIREHGLKAAVISGNHDTPRLPGTGSPYSALADTFPEMHFAHRLAYERFEVAGLVIHAVPQMMTVEAALEALDEAARRRDPGRTNLLLTHPRLVQLQPQHADINEIEVDAGRLRSDLVLLGHYHSFARVADGMWYAGSTDTFTFADDPGTAKGIVVLDTDSGECRHVPLEGCRPLVTLETVYALGLSPRELQERVLARASEVPVGAVARLYIDGIDPDVYRMLDMQEIRDAAAAALALRLEPQFVATTMHAELPTVTTLGAQWDGYLEGQDLTGLDRKRVRDLGHDYLDGAIVAAGGS